ncbi:MAG: carbamate kinase [Pseudomonadota bacterium]
MRIVLALGGNALLRRGEPMTAENQRRNIKTAATALAPIAIQHDVVISHGNGPQVGLLALQGAAYKPDEAFPLDILDAETEGMIGYLLEQELSNLLGERRHCATLLTQIEVDRHDPAFSNPSKPIGPIYTKTDAARIAKKRNWKMALDGDSYRRVVPSPKPKRILELGVIELLVNRNVVVICAGGGGIPVITRCDGSHVGIEAVIDKDSASALLARQLKAEAFLMLTDVDAVETDWGKPSSRKIRRASPKALRRYAFAAGSMGPKVEAACEFADNTGGLAGIGALKDTTALLAGEAGTVIKRGATLEWWE